MFDGKLTLTRLEKLERLKMLADKATGYQGKFCSCLHHDAMADPVLAASLTAAEHEAQWSTLRQWLGIRFGDIDVIFGPSRIEHKRAYLADLIADEKAGQ